MAQAYGPPKEIRVPKFDEAFVKGEYDPKLNCKLEDEYIAKVRAWVKARSTDKDAGEIIQFGVADGYAQYVVYTAAKLIHLPLGDGYSIPAAHMRGLRACDVRHMVKGERELAKLLGAKS